MNLPTYKEILPYVEKGLICEQSHPENPDVKIFNYSQKCQFDRIWDEVTMQCRGLILNVKTGEVLARPFPKFFNYGEYQGEIPTEAPIITEKMDGSLGVLYKLNGKYWIATRGSFTSEQANWATNFLRQKAPNLDLTDYTTHLFEIIYPENRIVVNYDFSGLILLASIITETGEDFSYYKIDPFPSVMKVETDDWKTLKDLNLPNQEGFVLHWPNKLRLKVKFDEYVRLHKLITGVSQIAIWEHLRDGNSLDDLLEKVPDEFFNWVKSVQDDLYQKFYEIEIAATQAVKKSELSETRKDKAAIIQGTPYPGVAFAILDKKNWQDAIWKLIRPKGQRVFKTDIDL